MPILFDIPISPYAQKVKLALLEKGIPFENRITNVDDPDPEFRVHSPRLEVPALLDEDFGLFDSSIIVEYIEDRWPEPPLLPESARERARVRTLEEICDTAYDAIVWGIAEVTLFRRAHGDTADRLLARAREQIAGLNTRLERDLVGREYFNGERFGFGDIAVYPFVNGAAAIGYKPEPGSKLEAWLKATRKRPSAERVKQDVAASLAEFAKKPELVASGKAKREYRDHRLDWMIRSGGIEVVLRGAQVGNIRFSRELE
jgi:glutathione S-transferase